MADFDIRVAIDRVWAEPRGTPAVILRRAEELFAEKGFDGVTIRDLAQAADVNVATVHFHWKTKQTLYEAVHRNLDLYLLNIIFELNRAVEEEGLDFAHQIDRWIDLSMRVFLERPTTARLTLQYLSRQAPDDSPEFLKHEVQLTEFLETEIARHLPEAQQDLDISLTMLCTTYYGLVLFCDSPLQRAILGGSVYESEALQQRVRDFGRRLLRSLVDLD